MPQTQVKVEGAKPFLVSRSMFFIALVRFSRCDTDRKAQLFDWKVILKVHCYARGLDARFVDRMPYLAVRRQIKVNYVWAFPATFADFKGR
jgi:hypothetical protein